MTRMILGTTVIGALGVLGAQGATGGCSAEAEPTYTSTAVHLLPDGTQKVIQGKITLSEQLRQNAARAALRENASLGLGTAREAISNDTSCGFGDMILYDQASYTGNQICFSGTGIADLTQYQDGCVFIVGHGLKCAYWNSSVKSYVGGVYSGWFEGSAQICGGTTVTHCPLFASWTDEAALSSCEQTSSHYLNLNNACTCPSGEVPCGSGCANTNTDPSNCGSCGYACPSHETCSGGSCACASPYTQCGSSCTNTATDPNNCGTCGHVCSVANGVAGCSAGACTVASCNTGYANCDGSYANGCEVNTGTDANNCGACNNRCGASSTCTSGSCSCMGDGDCSGVSGARCCNDSTVNSPNYLKCVNVENGCQCGNACFAGSGTTCSGPTMCCATGNAGWPGCFTSCGTGVATLSCQ